MGIYAFKAYSVQKWVNWAKRMTKGLSRWLSTHLKDNLYRNSLIVTNGQHGESIHGYLDFLSIKRSKMG